MSPQTDQFQQSTAITGETAPLSSEAQDTKAMEEGSVVLLRLSMNDVCFKDFQPQSLILENQTVPVSSWKHVFYLCCRHLAQRFPDIFSTSAQYPANSLMGRMLSRSASAMISPEEIAPGITIETHGSSDDLMNRLKRVARFCSADLDTIGIKSLRVPRRRRGRRPKQELTGSEADFEENDCSNAADVSGRGEFFNWLLNSDVTRDLAELYGEAMDALDKDLQHLGKQKRSLWVIRGIRRLEGILDEINNSDWWKDTPGSSVIFTPAAIANYISFRKGELACPGTHKVPAHLTIEMRRILGRFPEGFPANGRMAYLKIRSACPDCATLNDEEIRVYLLSVGSLRGDRIYPRLDNYEEDPLDDLEEELESMLEGGASCVWSEQFFSKHREALKSLKIYSPESLAETLVGRSYGRLGTDSEHKRLCRTGRKECGVEEIRDLVTQSTDPVALKDIASKLWHIPEDEISRLLGILQKNREGILNIGGDRWFSMNHFPASPEETRKLADCIHEKLKTGQPLTEKELTELSLKTIPALDGWEEHLGEGGLWKCIRFLIGDEFNFTRGLVTAKGSRINPEQIIREFCSTHDTFELSEVKSLLEEHGIQASASAWETIRGMADRISKDRFIAAGQLNFDVSAIDSVLVHLIPDDYLPLGRITMLGNLPPVYSPSGERLPWNLHLLESYVWKHSGNFKLLHRAFTGTEREEITGAVVRKTSVLKSFEELLSDALSRRDDWETQNDAKELLKRDGLITRLKYDPEQLERIMQKARELRRSSLREQDHV